jgi:hypothetical protein
VVEIQHAHTAMGSVHSGGDDDDDDDNGDDAGHGPRGDVIVPKPGQASTTTALPCRNGREGVAGQRLDYTSKGSMHDTKVAITMNRRMSTVRTCTDPVAGLPCGSPAKPLTTTALQCR